MKIIVVDNFGRESISDKLVCTNVSKYYGEIIVKALNVQLSGDYADVFYKLVQNDYKLYRFKP